MVNIRMKNKCGAYARKIASMSEEMWRAVDEERYERAAELRDQIAAEQERFRRFLTHNSVKK